MSSTEDADVELHARLGRLYDSIISPAAQRAHHDGIDVMTPRGAEGQSSWYTPHDATWPRIAEVNEQSWRRLEVRLEDGPLPELASTVTALSLMATEFQPTGEGADKGDGPSEHTYVMY